MYTIEYYKTKKEKPTIKEPEYSSDNKKMRTRYLHQKDIIDKCWNIKSLTIDLEDIANIPKDKKLKHLFSLYARVGRTNIDNSIKSITILNNNSSNLSYIYEIINCKWMVNNNSELSNIEVLKVIKMFFELTEKYDKETDSTTKNNIKNEITLIEYYLSTLINKHNNNISNTRTLKLGAHWIK